MEVKKRGLCGQPNTERPEGGKTALPNLYRQSVKRIL
jgi:hypothetical protein